MFFNSFGQIKIIAKPVYRAKGIQIIQFEYFAIFNIVSTVSLVYEIKNFCAKTKKR